MRKQYSKPDIMFESFSLSTSITAGCEKIIDNWGDNQCGLKWGNKYIFIENVSGCTRKVTEGDEKYDGLCYHTPYSTYNLFNS